jgi:hypothetical protein
VIPPSDISLGDSGFEHLAAENLKLMEIFPETGAETIEREH